MEQQPYTLLHVIRDMVTFNLKVASDEVVKERRRICSTCEARRGAVCSVCGCFLPAKTKLKPSYCPMELWMPEE